MKEGMKEVEEIIAKALSSAGIHASEVNIMFKAREEHRDRATWAQRLMAA